MLKQGMEDMAVQLLSMQADVTVAQQGTAALERKLRAAQQEGTAAVAQADAARQDILRLQVCTNKSGILPLSLVPDAKTQCRFAATSYCMSTCIASNASARR